MAKIFVKVLQTSGRSVLIEWLDNNGLNRGLIPQEVVDGDFVNEEHITLAVPYGVNWAFALQEVISKVTPDTFAQVLYQHNIWTLQDLTSDPQRAFTAIQAVYGLDYQELVKVAKLFTGG
jgi:hypothetical protein